MLLRSRPGPADADGAAAEAAYEQDDEDVMLPPPDDESVLRYDCASVADRARFIPVRLAHRERKMLRLVTAALNVSEYTDKVDVLSYGSRAKRIHKQLLDVCAILSGLMVASDYRQGQKLVKDKVFADNGAWFAAVFELARRYKVMNPDKMRGDYGKLIYLLQDSNTPEIQDLLEFTCVVPLKTVVSELEAGGAGDALRDPYIGLAVAEIDARGKKRYEVQREIKKKEKAVEHIAAKYASAQMDAEDIRQCLYSVADNNSFLKFNRDPVDRMLEYLRANFDQQRPRDARNDLGIVEGRGGARLTHDHARHFAFIEQTLSLWSDILGDFFRLWYLAEEDLLDPRCMYRLQDTGQGLNRMQQARRVSSAMHGILHSCQQRCGSWVGSSVVHLGDRAVPNALMFIDKYTQVPRILGPLTNVLSQLEPGGRLAEDRKLQPYLDGAFGGAEACKQAILTDFFRHAFNGSGADNFMMAGSCIDGRLTSAWNWCSKLEKKPWYNVFKLAGFASFDGKWD